MTNNTSLDSSKNLQYISEHKHVFKVESSCLLDSFEQFVEQAKGWGLECSCKIEKTVLYPSRFNLFYPKPNLEHLDAALNFLRQIEATYQVKLDDQAIDRFLDNDFDLQKVDQILVGVDLRPEFAASRLKIWFVLKDYPEKVEAAIHLCEMPEAARFLTAHLSIVVVGFDLFLGGRSIIELYPRILKNELQNLDVQTQLSNIFAPSTLERLNDCWAFGFGFSKANPEPILYYPTPTPNSFITSFKNPLVDRVHAHYREKNVLATIVAFRESEFLAGTIENLSLYFQMSLPFYKLPPTYKSLLPTESTVLRDLE
jgi:LynF/TruF/PatF family peptide O-prenyltransferase